MSLSPVERSYQHAMTHPEVVDAMAVNYYMDQTGDYSVSGVAAWHGLTDADRARWRQRTLDVLARAVVNEVTS